ncbi:4-hydroxy-tetrahydrodipicolinate reductase [Dongia sp.]|uniref:4-hydroxy-tetrahydrodipicolinate reductase n=1 Tax=Dongia sp. TaxID=1977262 RepID=UPI0035ADF030
MSLRICVGGATGWTGKALVAGIAEAKDLSLSGAVARKAAGEDAGTVAGIGHIGVPVSGSVAEALKAEPTDVYIDYTHPGAVKANVLTALELGVPVVVGTSGLGADDYAEIAKMAERQGLGVVASGNFSITASLMTRFSLLAAKHVPDYEIIDYAKSTKPDVPSGTARELAERMGAVQPSVPGYPIDQVIGPRESRGADVGGGRVHAVRLPSYVLAVETIFGKEGERLTIRHDAGSSAGPYVAGTLLAARRVVALKGLIRGLDNLLFGAIPD